MLMLPSADSEYAMRGSSLPPSPTADDLRALESESIHIMREVVAEFERPVMLYSVGKDSSVMLRLAQKAFHPGPIPFPLLHIDTTYKFREMITFRDRYTAEVGARLIVHVNEDAIAKGTQPFLVGTQRCCGLLKTRSLLDALEAGRFDAAFGGARRDEERSRAKERIFSLRDAAGQWDPKNQRPELWNLLNGRIRPGESMRVFPLSNWTEIDVWRYIDLEQIPVVPLYFAKEREVIVRGDALITMEQAFVPLLPGERPQQVRCRMRSLGCSPCTGAIRSDADTVPKIIDELIAAKNSERQLRIIDHDQDGSMEIKKREGYF
jgi:sulfate adenylyltransferase subunit 2